MFGFDLQIAETPCSTESNTCSPAASKLLVLQLAQSSILLSNAENLDLPKMTASWDFAPTGFVGDEDCCHQY